MTFAAQFPGKCSLCGEWFTEGTAIKHEALGHGWQHADCDADDSVTPTVAREVCDRCWLEKSITGECGCEP